MPEKETVGQQLAKLKAGRFITIQKIKPSGALQARKQSNGAITLYWRFNIGEKTGRVGIGLYDPLASPKTRTKTSRGYSIAAAISEAEAKASKHYESKSIGGYPALVEREQAEADARQRTIEKAAHFTLARLLEDYANHMETLGRRSHRDARSIFKLHVVERSPDIATSPAAGVSTEQAADMLRAVVKTGKHRTANKLRSYLHAAYQTAKKSRTKPTIPEHFKGYGIVTNPIKDIEPDQSANKADKNPLSVNELCRYWRALKLIDDFRGAVLRLHLLTGGQRIEQLVRLKTVDITADFDEIIILDGKGRPGIEVRKHIVPLTKLAKAALRACKPAGEYALSTDGGVTHISATTLSGWACEVVEGMESKSTIPNFQAKRIRSGVETLLSKAGANLEVRGHLQSHGISGVQKRSYDDNDFLREKRAALDTLFKTLENNTLQDYVR
ncbi:MAG: integrase [Betaproteobacteria bacterium]|nr:MAG: integrase [Betaproteobacteria bacterium]